MCGSRVVTTKENPNATNSKMKVIYVYSYDTEDDKDVLRIREEIRKLEFENKLSYKTDRATLDESYSNRRNKKYLHIINKIDLIINFFQSKEEKFAAIV